MNFYCVFIIIPIYVESLNFPSTLCQKCAWSACHKCSKYKYMLQCLYFGTIYQVVNNVWVVAYENINVMVNAVPLNSSTCLFIIVRINKKHF